MAKGLFSFSRREVSITGDSHSHPPTRQCRLRQMKDPYFLSDSLHLNRVHQFANKFCSFYNGMWFSSEKEFIQSGKTGQIEENPAGYAKLYKMLRSFPDGIRNCYNLSVEKGLTYLMRATFVYGNYDGLDIKPVFDLYLGPNPWDTHTIDLERVNGTRKGILHIPTSNSLHITQWVALRLNENGKAVYLKQETMYYNLSKTKHILL